jgi:hypothetical protein
MTPPSVEIRAHGIQSNQRRDANGHISVHAANENIFRELNNEIRGAGQRPKVCVRSTETRKQPSCKGNRKLHMTKTPHIRTKTLLSGRHARSHRLPPEQTFQSPQTSHCTTLCTKQQSVPRKVMTPQILLLHHIPNPTSITDPPILTRANKPVPEILPIAHTSASSYRRLKDHRPRR